MSFRVLPWILALALVGGTGRAQTPLDRERALKAPVGDLAKAALAAAAPKFVEVERPNFTGLEGPDAPLRGLRFATVPKMAGYPGLCQATTAWINVRGGSPPMETQTVYKIVGDLAPLPDLWNQTYETEITRKCASAGRVLPTHSAAFGETPFFDISRGGEDKVWMASRALQLAIAGAKTGAAVICKPTPGIDPADLREMAADDPEAIEDRENREGCADAAVTLAGLSLARLTVLDIAPCPKAKAEGYCLSATFLRFAYGNHQALWQVTLRYQEGDDDNRDAKAIDAVTLQSSFNIYD